MRHGSLFSGIGGFDLAAEWMGWKNVFHCEWMERPRKLLDYYWPDADSHINICETDFKKYENRIDILTGGFPCQPFSTAGKRKGTDDERYLWGEMLRAIQEIKPKFVIAENVYGITSIDGGLVFEQVCLDLEGEGYEVQPFIIPAIGKNAPHRRYRVFFIAYSNSRGNKRLQYELEEFEKCRQGGTCDEKNCFDDTSNTKCFRQQRSRGAEQPICTKTFGDKKATWSKHVDRWPTQSAVCRGNDGISERLDGITFSNWAKESIKGYGNAVVPQIALELFKQLEQLEQIQQ
jgi:DNA (cytosine-5)-methyltransferase 1